MGEHAVLSPSAAERWISCPASVQLIAKLPYFDESSSYAAEGTKAHALGEIEAMYAFGMVSLENYMVLYKGWEKTEPILSDDQRVEMTECIEQYVTYLQDAMMKHENSQLLLEQRVQSGIDNCWGTSDAIIVSPEHIEIVDLKYGQGVPVSAIGNPQLRLYGVGALEMYDGLLGDTEVVYCSVFQPRLNSASTEEITPTELRAWRDALRAVADEALNSPTPRFGPSAEACRWCEVAGTCRARIEKATSEDFGRKPDLFTPAELGELLGRIPEIKNWCDAVQAAALRLAYSEQVDIPGWKVVASGGKRVVLDEPAAIEVFLEKGYDASEVSVTKLKGIGDLEKHIKSRTTGLKKDATLESVIGNLVTKTLGSPSLAPLDDKRPAINPNNEAVKEFAE